MEVRERQCGCVWVWLSRGYYLIEDKLWLKRSNRGLSLWLHYSGSLILLDFLLGFRGEVLTARLYSPPCCSWQKESEREEVVTSSLLLTNPPSSPSFSELSFFFFSKTLVQHSQAACQQFSSCCGPWLSGSSVADWQAQWHSISGESSQQALRTLEQHCATSGTVFDPRSPRKPSWAVCCAFSTCTRRWRIELSLSPSLHFRFHPPLDCWTETGQLFSQESTQRDETDFFFRAHSDLSNFVLFCFFLLGH